MDITKDNLNILITQKSDKQISFNILGKTFQTTNDQTLIYNRGCFLVKYKNQVGDGQGLIFSLPRKQIVIQNIEKKSFLCGLGFFRQFDEKAGITRSYLYKYPKNKIDLLKNIIQKIGFDNLDVKTDGKFVFLSMGLNKPFCDDIDTFDSINNNINNILSFLFGLSLVYGSIDVKDFVLNSIKIHIPIKFGDFQSKKLLDDLVESLFKQWLFVKADFIEGNFGYTYQISISDWEVLDVFMPWFDKYEVLKIVENNKKTKIYSIRQDLYSKFNFDTKEILKVVYK